MHLMVQRYLQITHNSLGNVETVVSALIILFGQHPLSGQIQNGVRRIFSTLILLLLTGEWTVHLFVCVQESMEGEGFAGV